MNHFIELVKDEKYTVRVMTRDPENRRAKELAALPGVELFKGSFANEVDLTNGFKGCDGAVSLLQICLLFEDLLLLITNSWDPNVSLIVRQH